MELAVGNKALVPGYTVGGGKLVGTVTRLGRKTVDVKITVPSTGVKRVRTFPLGHGLVEPYVTAVQAAAGEGYHHVKLACPVCGHVRIPLNVKPSAFAAAHRAEHVA